MFGLTLRAAFAVPLSAGMLMVFGGTAAAAPIPGELFANGCLSNVGTTECATVPGATRGTAPGLALPTSTVVSPDGKYVYVTSQGKSALAVFKRSASGALVSDGCLAYRGDTTCDAVPGATRGRGYGLLLPEGVAASPDGRYVYTASYGDNSLGVFKRNPTTGALSSDGCLSAGSTCASTGGATNGQGYGLNSPQGITVSPDNAYVYVANFDDDAIAVFKRNLTTGALTSDGCVQETGETGCDGTGFTTTGEAPGLTHPESVATSSDGHYVYVGGGDAIVVFRRTASGALAPQGCIGDHVFGTECGSSPGFTHDVEADVRDLNGVAVSPDGQYVYAAAKTTNAVLVLHRDLTTGALSWGGCLSSDTPCTTGATQGTAPLAGANAVAVSPDNAYIYVAAYSTNAITVLKRGPAGVVSSDGCLVEPGSVCASGSGATHGTARGLLGPQGLAVSPNGLNIYVAGALSNSVAVFDRYFTPPPPPTPKLTGLRVKPKSFRAATSGPSVTTKKVGTTVRYRLNVAGSVKFKIERLLSGRRVGKKCVAQTKRNRHKPACRRVILIRASLGVAGRAGLNSFRFSGRFGGRTLAPGRYRLLAVASAAGKSSARASASFTILPRRNHK